MKRAFLIGIITLLNLQKINAQSSLDLVTVSGRYGFTQQAGEPIAGNNSEIGSLINIKIPIVLSSKSVWYSSVTYVSSHVKTDVSLGSEILNPIDVNGIILQTGLVQTLNEKQKLQLLFAPRFMSDFENTTKDNWQFGGIILFENRYNQNLMLRFGALYNSEQFGPSLTPLLHVDWKISPKWSFLGMLPIYAKVNYKVNENFTTGFSHFALITSYRLGNVNYSNDYIERTSIDLTLFARQRMFNNLFVEGRLGYAVGRRYEQYAEDQKVDFRLMIINFGDNRVVKNVIMKDGPIANLRLVYNLPLE
ncbi:hypothetical protein MNBD_BACTEROID06-1814 [hydrothermal vent metagenome]|uniref:DUF6268 domain-containing protein n=1 Tax=hydrothermal vent metagenome TaxID=652676 RepID=A0A3B0UCZ7_9ZZZZ